MLRPPTPEDIARVRCGMSTWHDRDWHLFWRRIPPHPAGRPFPREHYTYAQALAQLKESIDLYGIGVIARATRLRERGPKGGLRWAWTKIKVVKAPWFVPERELHPTSALLRDPSTWY